MPPCIGRGQRKLFSPSTMWVPEMELQVSGVATHAFDPELSPWMLALLLQLEKSLGGFFLNLDCFFLLFG